MSLYLCPSITAATAKGQQLSLLQSLYPLCALLESMNLAEPFWHITCGLSTLASNLIKNTPDDVYS